MWGVSVGVLPDIIRRSLPCKTRDMAPKVRRLAFLLACIFFTVVKTESKYENEYKSVLFCITTLAKHICYIVITVSCSEYGVGSECTDGFPSLYHIEGNTDLENEEKRQVIIPDINFTCNGTINKWIFGAKWKGNTQAFTELQIWRRTSDTEYTKVGNTTIMAGSENDSNIYEYQLDTPLAFQEGDILGYFQPKKDKSELDLYLENSERLTTYHISLGNSDFTSDGHFTLPGDDTDSKYPLIAVKTGTRATLVSLYGS